MSFHSITPFIEKYYVEQAQNLKLRKKCTNLHKIIFKYFILRGRFLFEN